MNVLGRVWVFLHLKRKFHVLLLLTSNLQDLNIMSDFFFLNFIHSMCGFDMLKSIFINYEIYVARGLTNDVMHLPFSELIIVCKDNMLLSLYFSSQLMGGNIQWNENQEVG